MPCASCKRRSKGCFLDWWPCKRKIIDILRRQGQVRVFPYGQPVNMRLSFDGLYPRNRCSTTWNAGYTPRLLRYRVNSISIHNARSRPCALGARREAAITAVHFFGFSVFRFFLACFSGGSSSLSLPSESSGRTSRYFVWAGRSYALAGRKAR